ncbi:MerR family transcriptional regulator [Alkaliphilus peptidifermentans]|uniref:DNA-binding transcriptional regulator, MerR family n=1 Tax=Alkaliphilus peptidifermentans DSM 18978 TaxID=1120976 RepID=A0A1G5KM58_9FIRM|nr:MerR family transcriptional regulator [Alkaliphilus peptidifermentans]SCZ01672.1 DNA-binding transcriptional regulator, MerR family [Alkaliphilus peptidifermentans DSM 18978]
MKYYKTSEIAKMVGVHPNTVRLYEEWGFLQVIPRNSSGYRVFTEEHLEQMKLARMALRCQFVEGNIRKMAAAIVRTAAQGNLKEALEKAFNYLLHIKNERVRAEEVLDLIDKWINGEMDKDTGIYYKRMNVAKLLNVSIDVLRNWERNGLIDTPRNDKNNYRMYGPYEINRIKVIRTLRSANYSIMSIHRMLRFIDKGQKDNIKELINTPLPHEDIISATDRWISTLIESEKDARDVINQLKKMNRINYKDTSNKP